MSTTKELMCGVLCTLFGVVNISKSLQTLLYHGTWVSRRTVLTGASASSIAGFMLVLGVILTIGGSTFLYYHWKNRSPYPNL